MAMQGGPGVKSKIQKICGTRSRQPTGTDVGWGPTDVGGDPTAVGWAPTDVSCVTRGWAPSRTKKQILGCSGGPLVVKGSGLPGRDGRLLHRPRGDSGRFERLRHELVQLGLIGLVQGLGLFDLCHGRGGVGP